MTALVILLSVLVCGIAIIDWRLITMASKFDGLRAEVAEIATTVDSAVALIAGLAAALGEAKDDPVAIQAIIDDLNASQEALAAAVAENTDGVPADAGTDV